MKKRLFCLVLVCLMVFAALPMLIGAEGDVDPSKKLAISIKNATVSKIVGSTVSVDVWLDENPGGIVSATIPVVWDEEYLTLMEVTNYHDTIKNHDGTEKTGWIGADIPADGDTSGLYYLAWNNDTMCKMVNDEPTEDSYTGTGRLCTLKFKLIEDIEEGEELPVLTIQPGEDDKLFTVMAWNMDDYMETAGTITLNKGEVTVVDVILGDVNGDNKVNDRDAIYLLYHYYFGSQYPVNQDVDFNNDDKVNDRDAIYLLYHYYFGSQYPLN